MTTRPASSKRWGRIAAAIVAMLLLAGVFMLYTRPEFMLRMADHVWACF